MVSRMYESSSPTNACMSLILTGRGSLYKRLSQPGYGQAESACGELMWDAIVDTVYVVLVRGWSRQIT
jgi:hypothetical protein